jgi:hypothetical protein
MRDWQGPASDTILAGCPAFQQILPIAALRAIVSPATDDHLSGANNSRYEYLYRDRYGDKEESRKDANSSMHLCLASFASLRLCVMNLMALDFVSVQSSRED